jgi:hypothetical protein
VEMILAKYMIPPNMWLTNETTWISRSYNIGSVIEKSFVITLNQRHPT